MNLDWIVVDLYEKTPKFKNLRINESSQSCNKPAWNRTQVCFAIMHSAKDVYRDKRFSTKCRFEEDDRHFADIKSEIRLCMMTPAWLDWKSAP